MSAGGRRREKKDEETQEWKTQCGGRQTQVFTACGLHSIVRAIQNSASAAFFSTPDNKKKSKVRLFSVFTLEVNIFQFRKGNRSPVKIIDGYESSRSHRGMLYSKDYPFTVCSGDQSGEERKSHRNLTDTCLESEEDTDESSESKVSILNHLAR